MISRLLIAGILFFNNAAIPRTSMYPGCKPHRTEDTTARVSSQAIPPPSDSFFTKPAVLRKMSGSTIRKFFRPYFPDDRDLAHLIFGSGLSNIGDYIQNFAQVMLLNSLTHSSASWLAWDASLMAAGIALGFAFGAPMADRFGHRLYVGLTMAQGVLSLVVGCLVFTAMAKPSLIVLCSFAYGVSQGLGASQFFRLAKQIRDSLATHQRSQADGWGQLKMNIARTIGPLLGALSVSWVGISVCYGINAFTFFTFAWVSLNRMQKRLSPSDPVPSTSESSANCISVLRNWMGFWREGLTSWKNQAPLVFIFVLGFFVAFSGIPTYSILGYFSKGQAQLLGLLQSTYFVGAVVANALGLWLSQRVSSDIIDRRPWIAPILLGIAIILFASVNTIPLKIASAFLVGGAFSWSRLLASNYANHLVSNHLIVRTQVIYVFLQHFGQFMGNGLLSGLAKTTLDVSGALVSLGAGLIVATLGWTRFYFRRSMVNRAS